MTATPKNTIKVERHPIDQAFAKDRFQFFDGLVKKLVVNARDNVDFIDRLFLQASTLAQFAAALPNKMAQVDWALRLTAQAAAAMFVSRSPKRASTRCTLGVRERFVLSGPVGEEYLDAVSWLQGFYCAAATRQPRVLDQLCAAPISLTRECSTEAMESSHLQVDALRALWLKKANVPARLKEVRAALTDHDRFVRACRGFGKVKEIQEAVEHFDLPEIQCLLDLVAGKNLHESFRRALELHRDHCARLDRRNDHQGFLAVDLLGIAVLARQRRIRLDVASEYVPAAILRGDKFAFPF
ncbi:MAG: immunity 49 family protein [Gemmataceae bacterium]